jgi:HTH-type transcriptional regulator, cell division transcriptional repressor
LRHGHIPRLTQDQLAGRLAKLGVSLDRVAIAKIETGIRCVFDYEVKALAAALNADLSSLFSEAKKATGKRAR